ncbi:hypothetical protein GHT06_020070 [Daphnia sinensis]|uniref:Uncharacterized protein n=1 Tax=Daphnia sinensis TaxID=1820382 RepID=A0AAD5LBV6_9CRUS|nr:hypothetical protein GHT06_020070 [Daphnia sinensis]
MDDEDDEWIGECLLVAGFITGIVVITLCISVYYICCHCPRQANRRKAKHTQQRQLREPSVASTTVDAHESYRQGTEHHPDGGIATQEFPSFVSMTTQYSVESAPPPYYVSEGDPPPPYSVDDASAEIITEKPASSN